MDRKQIFDAVRALLGRGFSRSEVARLDRAIDCANGEEGACDASQARAIGQDGIALIKRFEGCARLRPDGLVQAYPDPASSLHRTGRGSGAPWTIGWGATGPGVTPDTVWTQEECDARLQEDLVRYAADVARALDDAPTTQQQFDALVSFHYNTGAIERATLTRRHREGDYWAAQAEFARWNRAGGRVLKGLSRRRAAEAALYARQ